MSSISRYTSADAVFTAGGGTQINGYAFGQGANCNGDNCRERSGGGGGYYGGENNPYCSGGGSGYIENSLLNKKVMYCYNCTESTEENTKTISTICSEESPTENCSKEGNGYARITLISVS